MVSFNGIRPSHRQLWSGLESTDPSAEIGVLGVPFDGATSYRKGAALAPAKIRGVESNGMLLAASAEDGSVHVLTVDGDVSSGLTVK